MKRNYLLTLLCLLVAVLMPNEVWALRYAGVNVYSEPSKGGFVWVTKTENNLPSTWEKTDDSTDDWNYSTSNYTFYFYRYCSVNPGYVFKGWATSSTANSSTDTEAKVGVATTSANNTSGKRKVDTYYAIFARLAVDDNNAKSQSYDFGEVKRSVKPRPTHTFAINHAHAGKVTASLSNTTHFAIDRTGVVANSTTEGTEYIVVTYNPPCYDDGEHSTVLTITSDNGLNDIKVTITAKSVKDSQELSWVEPINTNILKGTTAKIEATATSGLGVTYTSDNTNVLTVDTDGNITAVGEGGATITASQAGDCTYAAATSITKKFTVSDKKTPTFWLENNPELTEKNLMVDGTTTINITNIDTESFNADYDANLLGFSLVDGVATITAKNEGTATLTLTQTETNAIFAASSVFTFHISKHTGTLALTNNLGTAYKVDDAVNIVDCYTASNSEVKVQVASSNADVIAVVEGKLKAVGVGTATVTFKQAETYKWTELTASQEITVTKYDLSASISQSAATWDATINNPFAISHNLNDYTVEALDPAIATYTNGAIQTYAETGTARFVISRVEDYKYNQLAETLSISVAPAQKSCYVLEDTERYSMNYGASHTFNLNGIGELLSLDIWKNSSVTTGSITVYGYTEKDATGTETQLLKKTVDNLSTSAQNFSVKIAREIKSIKVKESGQTLYKYVQNIKVTRANFLTPSAAEVSMSSTIGTNAEAKVGIDYSSCGGTVKVVSDNPKITVVPASFNAEGSGTQKIILTGDAAALGTEMATITIYDQSKKTTINVTSTITRIPQTITWNNSFENLDVYSTVALDATASGATEVTYSIAEEDQAKATIVDNVLSFNEVGTVHVVATAAQSDIYETASDTVSVVVSLAQPVVSVLPTVEAIAYGTALTDAMLQGGVAKYGESAVEGSFAWADEQITDGLTPNTYSFNVRFTPKDAAHYSTANCTVEVTVNKADPVVSQWPAATLTYGETLAGVVLAGESAYKGAFRWGDTITTAHLDAVKTAGVYTYQVKFVPDNSEQFNTVYGEATITIEEAKQEITWENYPSMCNVGDQIPLAAVASSRLSVEYSIDQNGNYATIDPETNILTALAQGTITLEVNQRGEEGKYRAAEPMRLSIEILPKQATGTNPVTEQEQADIRKVMRNGVLYIQRDGQYYDTCGRRVSIE